MYDDYMLCKLTLGVLKGASKLNVLLLFIIKVNCILLELCGVFTARHQRVINPAVAMLEVLGKVNKPHAKVNKAHAAVDPEYLRGKW